MTIFIFILQQMMVFSIPLLVVALAAMYSERSGVINIGLEGIMVMGAFAGTLYLHFANLSENFQSGSSLLIAILLSVVVGILYSALHAFASINMFADQTISGTALNMFAGAFSIFVARSMVGIQQIAFTGDFAIAKVPVLGDIPFIGEVLFQGAYITTYIGILILIASQFILYHTRFGLRLRSAGEFPQATDAAGVSVSRIRWAGVLISGALGGFGGLAYILPIATEFNGEVAGYGFLAIAVLIFGQWKPLPIALAAFFFGLLKTVSAAYSGIPVLAELGIPQVFYNILPYIITIVVLFLTSKKSRAPAAEGQPFDKGKR
ncbi:MAG: ABC transporter permease [Peptoniphilaceae bacterium]|nr:ABC transporter permease [Peptoniphilaceae bacterium]MDD7434736.1 ABC transporter permease [Peptoniphilaceae bacterium]MDY3075749.1 ABC transporter permease [Peptoniphilaceae bacterium]MDY4196821.1 ABC transporter permease [Peptoniphilaceae bacterium]MDY5842504.1 ABC transporter permease [Peptoniphilaceae bacterium]